MTWLDALLQKAVYTAGVLIDPLRPALDFIAGDGFSITSVDDPINKRTRVEFSAAGLNSHVVLAEGSVLSTGSGTEDVLGFIPEEDGIYFIVAELFGQKSAAAITGNPNLTFAEVGGTGDTITRAAGNWQSDNFAAGDYITVTGSASNNFANQLITAASTTVLTLDTQDLAAEGPSGNITVTAGTRAVFMQLRRAFSVAGGVVEEMVEDVDPPEPTVFAGDQSLVSSASINTDGTRINVSVASPSNTRVNWLAIAQRSFRLSA